MGKKVCGKSNNAWESIPDIIIIIFRSDHTLEFLSVRSPIVKFELNGGGERTMIRAIPSYLWRCEESTGMIPIISHIYIGNDGVFWRAPYPSQIEQKILFCISSSLFSLWDFLQDWFLISLFFTNTVRVLISRKAIRKGGGGWWWPSVWWSRFNPLDSFLHSYDHETVSVIVRGTLLFVSP